MKIITITLNPVFDFHFEIDNFSLGGQNYAAKKIEAAGGKGINISSALYSCGVDSTAYIVMGKQNSAAFESLLDNGDRLKNKKIVYVDGYIRENTIIKSSNNSDTRIGFDNFSLCDSALDTLFELMEKQLDEDRCIVAFAGKIPKGLTCEAVFDFLFKIKSKNALLVIDSNSFTLGDLCRIKPWLIKPNDEEIAALVGKEIKSPEDALHYATLLCEEGIQNVLVTLGGNGSAFASKELCATINTPKIKVASTVGAGDSTIAGFIAAYCAGLPVSDCLCTAVAYGSAACLTEGTLPPLEKDVQRIIKQVTVTAK